MSAATLTDGTDNAMNPDLMDFLREKVNTFTKWDLVRFFHDNPHAAEIAPNIAEYIGRDAAEVEQALASLVDNRVLRVKTMSDVQVFRLVDEPATLQMIRDFVCACDDPDFRVRVINEVIGNSR